MDTQEEYQRFALEQALSVSPTYERLASAVAGDPVLLELLQQVSPAARQPNLLFGAVRYLGGPVQDPALFSTYVEEHWEAVVHLLRTRTTQTNEAGRCATLLPALAGLPGPLALLEVGASAGLCLHPDRYAYEFRLHPARAQPSVNGAADAAHPEEVRTERLGSGPVVLPCDVLDANTSPAPLPDDLPHVVWRAGIDLNPLDVTDADDLRWLQALIWPEHTHRQQRLLAAARAITRASPPLMVTGDLLEQLPALVVQARRSAPAATVVVFHSAVLVYLDLAARSMFADLVTELGVRWISNEGLHVFPAVAARLPPAVEVPPGAFVLSIDAMPVALTAPHGQWIRWLPPVA